MVNITNPINGEHINGPSTIIGIIQGPEGTHAEINIDDSGWLEIEPGYSWKYYFNTNNLSDGNHIIKARASWHQYQSNITSVTFSVYRPKKVILIEGWPILLLLIVLIFILFFIYYEWWNKTQEKTISHNKKNIHNSRTKKRKEYKYKKQ
jgi:hypothetical protein